MTTSLFLAAFFFTTQCFGGPVPIPGLTETETDRLEAHIVSISPKTAPYARLLADTILTGALSHALDPAFLAAIAWTESGFKKTVEGAAGEIGLWQLLPRGWLAKPWDEIRGTRPSWWGLKPKSRRALCRDISIGSYFAFWILDYHFKRCSEEKAVCYAAYQSGNHRRVNRKYVRAIRGRARIIRRVLRGE